MNHKNFTLSIWTKQPCLTAKEALGEPDTTGSSTKCTKELFFLYKASSSNARYLASYKCKVLHSDGINTYNIFTVLAAP
jgi:hypothetical protein